VSDHRAIVEWKRQGDFLYATYSRMHEVRFDSGLTLAGRASPSNIPKTAPTAPGVDPEEAFVAAVSQCHMLWFLHLALEAKLVVERYVDEAVGRLDRTWISQVILRPRVAFSGRAPTEEQHRALHHKAHEKCFIANSIKSEVIVEPGIDQR
jgi:organic hydroperoxide reductase OsmC/OhrA